MDVQIFCQDFFSKSFLKKKIETKNVLVDWMFKTYLFIIIFESEHKIC
jgi:hypothetical protein